MEVKEVRTFIRVTIVIWSLAFVGGFITGKSAFATQPYNVEVRDHQKTVIKRTPQVVEVCSERKVSGDKTADTILGAIIGGAIGQNVTKDLPDGATAGAIIGGILGINQIIIGGVGVILLLVIFQNGEEMLQLVSVLK